MSTEKWKPIKGFHNKFVSNHGRVRWLRPLDRTVYYRTYPTATGALSLQIKEDGIPHNLRLSRLVGEAFCSDFHPSLVTAYKDGDKSNCAASNLRWVRRAEITGHPFSRNPRPAEALRA